jgi:uncharacterized protein
MHDEQFEWDDEKARANLVKHRIDFYDAVLVFGDPAVCDDPDDSMDYDEERFKAVGMVEGVVITVVYCLRGRRTRLISARKPTRQERANYARQNPAL